MLSSQLISIFLLSISPILHSPSNIKCFDDLIVIHITQFRNISNVLTTYQSTTILRPKIYIQANLNYIYYHMDHQRTNIREVHYIKYRDLLSDDMDHEIVNIINSILLHYLNEGMDFHEDHDVIDDVYPKFRRLKQEIET